MTNTDAMNILNTIIENGRVLAHDDGSFITASLEAEAEYEAVEDGWTSSEVQEAVAFALAHSEHHE